MIEISHTPNKIAVIGHANYAPAGSDIVCAGISALTYTLVLSLEELTADEIQSELSAGNAVVRYKENLSERAQVLIDSFFVGVKLIADTYPDNVRLV